MTILGSGCGERYIEWESFVTSLEVLEFRTATTNPKTCACYCVLAPSDHNAEGHAGTSREFLTWTSSFDFGDLVYRC